MKTYYRIAAEMIEDIGVEIVKQELNGFDWKRLNEGNVVEFDKKIEMYVDGNVKLFDIFSVSVGIDLYSNKFCEAVKKFVPDFDVQMFPVILHHPSMSLTDHYILNVVLELNALDIENSIWLDDNPEAMALNPFYLIALEVLEERIVHGHHLFRLHIDGKYRSASRIFISEELKNALEIEDALKGFYLTEIKAI